MSKIVAKNGSMAVTFGNDTRTQPEPVGFTGTVCQMSWDNAAVMHGLRQMFGCTERERIVAIEVDHYGIKAKFERT